MRNKYRNSKVIANGETYDSQIEYARANFLRNREKAGELEGLRRQVEYPLIPAQYREEVVQLKTKTKIVNKLVERPCSYVADFVYTRNGKEVVEDVKGSKVLQTPDFKIKKKLMLYVHGIEVKIITSASSWE